MIGCKLLRADGSSINDNYGRVTYPVGEWVDVPGNGAYVAITDGLTSGGFGPVVAWMECDEDSEVDVSTPRGVRCFARVRRLSECPTDYDGPLRVRTVNDPAAEVVVEGGEQVVIHAAASVTINNGGWCGTFGDSHPTITLNGGRCYTYNTSHPAITINNGGWCGTCGDSHPTITLNGGACGTYDNSHPAVTVNDGRCNTYDTSHPAVTVNGGWCGTFGDSHPTITLNSGYCGTFDNSHPTIHDNRTTGVENHGTLTTDK